MRNNSSFRIAQQYIVRHNNILHTLKADDDDEEENDNLEQDEETQHGEIRVDKDANGM